MHSLTPPESAKVKLTTDQGIHALVEFREKVIRAEVPEWEGHRSILRDAMIGTMPLTASKAPTGAYNSPRSLMPSSDRFATINRL